MRLVNVIAQVRFSPPFVPVVRLGGIFRIEDEATRPDFVLLFVRLAKPLPLEASLSEAADRVVPDVSAPLTRRQTSVFSYSIGVFQIGRPGRWQPQRPVDEFVMFITGIFGRTETGRVNSVLHVLGCDRQFGTCEC
jgi:hypothetical protein